MDSMPAITDTLDRIGPRLRRLREKRNLSLTRLGDITGISKSTLSRLESAQRKPSLELLLPIAAALSVSLDDIVAAPRVVAPRVVPNPRRSNGRVFLSLSRQQEGEPRAFRVTIPRGETEAVMRTHTGYAWLYVLTGRLRLILGEQDVILGPGEVAEFDTRHPHWFGSSGHGDVEVLSLFGKQGERIRVRVSGRPPTA